MCDYSLCGLPTRLSVEGEELIVHRFSTGSMGLAAPVDLRVELEVERSHRSLWQRIKDFFEEPRGPIVPAVCVPPGAQLILKNIPSDLQRRWHVPESQGVVFVQISAEINSYRDAIQFDDGRQLRLQDLREGLRVKVVSLEGTTVVDEPNFAMELR